MSPVRCPDVDATAKDFIDNIFLSVAWDEMHGCVEAAPSDCPHQEMIESMFSIKLSHDKLRELSEDDQKLGSFVDTALSSDQLQSAVNDEIRTREEMERLLKLAFRVHTAAKKLPTDAPLNKWRHRCHQPLADGMDAKTISDNIILPNMQVSLPANEASQDIAQSALRVREVEIMSSLGVTLDEESLKSCLGSGSPTSPSLQSARGSPHAVDASKVRESLSPLVNPSQPEFFGAIFHSSACEDRGNSSGTKQFYQLHRYSHLATSSLARQLNAFGIELPVVGVLFSGSRVAFHVDWASAVDEREEINSALYTPDEIGEDFRQWDLCQPADALEVVLILDNLRRFVFGEFKSGIESALSNFRSRIYPGEFKSWRWDGQMLVDHGDVCLDDYEESRSTSSLATEEEEQKIESPVHIAIDVRVQDTEEESSQLELLTAALTLQEKTGIDRRALKRLLPSPPRTPSECGTQTPVSESQ